MVKSKSCSQNAPIRQAQMQPTNEAGNKTGNSTNEKEWAEIRISFRPDC